MTNRAALEALIAEEHRWPADRSNPVYEHLGAWWNNAPLVQEAFGGRIDDLETMRRASQWLQYDGLRYAVEATLRRGAGDDPVAAQRVVPERLVHGRRRLPRRAEARVLGRRARVPRGAERARSRPARGAATARYGRASRATRRRASSTSTARVVAEADEARSPRPLAPSRTTSSSSTSRAATAT